MNPAKHSLNKNSFVYLMMDHWNTMSDICWPKFGTNHIKKEDPQKRWRSFLKSENWIELKRFFVLRQVKIKVFS